MCICFFDDGPIDKDPRANRGNMFKVGMKDAPCKDPAICCAGFLCNPCVGFYMRKKVLGGNMDLYMCCQGYYDGLCCGHPKAGSYGDTGNPACMACEMCCCPGWATSATRQYVMDQYDLASDPCDRQIIRFNNFMQLLSCICYTLAIIEPSCRDLADLVGCIADLVFYATAACMFAQVNYELTEREKAGSLGAPRGGGQAMTAPNCVEINQCVGCTRQFNTKSFLGNDAAVLARSSGEEQASPRHRAGVASMAWRSTRRFSTNAP